MRAIDTLLTLGAGELNRPCFSCLPWSWLFARAPRGVAYNPNDRVPPLRVDSGSSARAAKGSSSTAPVAVARSSPSGT